MSSFQLNGDRQIEKKIVVAGVESVFITVITECELFYGAYKSARVEKNLALLKDLREKLRTIQTSRDVSPLYGRVKADLERKGRAIDDADLLIASIVLTSKGILVTNNTSHFRRVLGLQVENWR